MAVPPPNAASARALRERKAQLDRLLSDELPRNRREIQEAKEFGDLSENFEYESARNRERQLLAKLETLQREIREAAEFDFSLAEAGEEAAPGRFKMKIDSSLCAGCSHCTQVCKFGAIKRIR